MFSTILSAELVSGEPSDEDSAWIETGGDSLTATDSRTAFDCDLSHSYHWGSTRSLLRQGHGYHSIKILTLGTLTIFCTVWMIGIRCLITTVTPTINVLDLLSLSFCRDVHSLLDLSLRIFQNCDTENLTI